MNGCEREGILGREAIFRQRGITAERLHPARPGPGGITPQRLHSSGRRPLLLYGPG